MADTVLTPQRNSLFGPGRRGGQPRQGGAYCRQGGATERAPDVYGHASLHVSTCSFRRVHDRRTPSTNKQSLFASRSCIVHLAFRVGLTPMPTCPSRARWIAQADVAPCEQPSGARQPSSSRRVFLLVHTYIPPGTLVAYRATDDRVGHGRDRITVRLETRSDALARQVRRVGVHVWRVSQEGELQLCQYPRQQRSFPPIIRFIAGSSCSGGSLKPPPSCHRTAHRQCCRPLTSRRKESRPSSRSTARQAAAHEVTSVNVRDDTTKIPTTRTDEAFVGAIGGLVHNSNRYGSARPSGWARIETCRLRGRVTGIAVECSVIT